MSRSPTSILGRDVLPHDDDNNNESIKTPIFHQQVWKTPLPASAKALRTTNPIRAIVDPIVANMDMATRTDGKKPISLALGDPTAAGNLPPCPVALQAVAQALNSPGAAAGYVPACGTLAARQAIAQFHSCRLHQVQPNNVIVANGCSGALELALTAVLDPGSVLLVPQPGFPLYKVIAESHGAIVAHYRLDSQWQCDLNHLQAIMMQQQGHNVPRALVINNPSNPTGAVFSKKHLQDIIRFCDKHGLLLIADEVYGDLTFAGGHEFYPAAQVAAELGSRVPVITASGLSKQFLVPGWRVGWIVFHDNIYGSLEQIEAGAKRLAQVILGASHLVQTAIPALLDPSNPSIQQWRQSLRQTLQSQAQYLCHRLSSSNDAPGLHVLAPGGTMYAMVRIDVDQFDDSIQNELDFTKKLLQEENVFVLPGSCFGMDNVFRVVYCAPVPVLEEAANRICQFCQRHEKQK